MTSLAFCVLLLASVASAQDTLMTTAEQSGWLRTGRADETQRLCRAFEKRFPEQVKCLSYGTTPQNRSLPYMVIGDRKSPVVWVQAGIHAGEIDGKDAVFYILREALENKLKPNPLKGLCLVFVPIVNLDGHERFGRWNRPNQVGPEEMGWRTTAQNLNLNRDFMKADAPEMQALLKLWHKMDPVLSLDLHVTNGAQFQPEVGLIVLPVAHYGASPLHQAGSAFEAALLTKMEKRHHQAMPFYPDFEVEGDPLSGFSRYVATLRFAHGYWQANNRLGMLVEAHSWKDYATRVKTHISTVISSLEIAQERAKEWRRIALQADAKSIAGQKLALSYTRTEKSRPLEFAGYKYAKHKSEISGADVIKYFPAEPQIWKVPFYEELVPSLETIAPEQGYFIQAQDARWILPRLAPHGIQHRQWKQPLPTGLQVFRASKTQFTATPIEGHQTLIVEGSWKPEEVSGSADLVFVPIQQPKARLVVEFFEPTAKDSFVSWGFFNKVFEAKEYMEDYVAEDVAIEMLKDTTVRDEFEKKLKTDKAFAKDPAARFEFFYRKHPSWDDRFNKYPVWKK